MSTASLVMALFFLIGALSTTGILAAADSIGKTKIRAILKQKKSSFFFASLLTIFFKKTTWDTILFSLTFSRHFFYLAYTISSLCFLIFDPSLTHLFSPSTAAHLLSVHSFKIAGASVLIIFFSLFVDLFIKGIAIKQGEATFRFLARLASFYLTVMLPITAPLTQLFFLLCPSIHQLPSIKHCVADKILEVLHDIEISYDTDLDPQEKNVIISIANFTKRCVREVMVPRIHITAVSHDISLEETAAIFIQERYSRLPVYQDTIDHIVGMLLYKDVLSAYTSHPLTSSIQTLIKPILYTPEMKKISALLQEFRSKQCHLAIVVDEYGGTEGIITIEDILEELVGEIADEDDVSQEQLFCQLAPRQWIVDARMTILDIEKELSVHIPPSGEYDTLGGYIYHQAKSIPSQGWKLHHDHFDLEILSSDERSLEKVKIISYLSKE